MKLKWKVDRKNKQWYIIETVPYANDGFTITKTSDGLYRLVRDYSITTMIIFKKLSSAKKVAELIKFG
jgi:hypothetical protein